MGKLSKILGLSMDDEEAPVSGPTESEDKAETDAEAGDSEAETLAMKQFSRAATPEAKARALRAFLEACGVL